MQKMFGYSLAAALSLALIASPALGDQIKRSSYDRYEGQWWRVNAGPLNVRADPRIGSPVVTQLSPGDEVAALEMGREVTIGDRRGQWVFVGTSQCINNPCEHVIAGWVASFYLDDPEDLVGRESN